MLLAPPLFMLNGVSKQRRTMVRQRRSSRVLDDIDVLMIMFVLCRMVCDSTERMLCFAFVLLFQGKKIPLFC